MSGRGLSGVFQVQKVVLGGMRSLQIVLLVMVMAVTTIFAQGVQAQVTTTTSGEPSALVLEQGGEKDQAVDYAAWDAASKSAEETLALPTLTSGALEMLRATLVEWRNKFSAAQSVNSSRIVTVRNQLEALGAPPADGQTEAAEIAARRAELNKLLGELQAPGLSAEEAYRHADGLIREIDQKLRLQQADELLQIWPSPLNPVHWGEATVAVGDTLGTIWKELDRGWHSQSARSQAVDNLPVILLLLVASFGMIFFARRWVSKIAERLQKNASQARQHFAANVLSLVGGIIPVLGVFALSQALDLTNMLGRISGRIVDALPLMAWAIYSAAWLAQRQVVSFVEQSSIETSSDDEAAPARNVISEMSARRWLDFAMAGIVVALEIFRSVAMDAQDYSNAVNSVISFPILCFGGLILWRLGSMLNSFSKQLDGPNYSVVLLSLAAKACIAISILGPILAGFGYVSAAKSMIFPAILSVGLYSAVMIFQNMLMAAWHTLLPPTVNEDGGEEQASLASVVFGFSLVMISLPLLALIWGARVSDLTEVWTKFQAGFQLGETRISPIDFVIFAMLFALGYMATRLVQGALRNTILPRTKLDRGGQNAVVSGVGYLGIFISALIAIRSTGIDLSGFAIVASALSVGIGFGLQNIVQNFVSGVILMIERPVSEGDWIEVGTTQGIVTAISVRSTRIQTFDRNVVVVPNADLVSQRVTNWTRFGLAGRLIVPIGVSYGTDTRRVDAILREIAEAQPMVILNPPPTVLLRGFGPDSMNFELRVVLRDVNASSAVASEINHQIVERFAQEQINIPYVQREVTLSNIDDLARAVQTMRNALASNDDFTSQK